MSSSTLGIGLGLGYNPELGPLSTTPIQNSSSSSTNLNSPSKQSSTNQQVQQQQQQPPPPPPSSSSQQQQQQQQSSIYDRNLHRQPPLVSLSSLSYLFMQIVSRNFTKSKTLPEVERKLNNMGYSIGIKYLELISLRTNFNNSITSSGKSNISQRQIKLLEILQFITLTIWPSLFNKQADNLEKSTDDDLQFMIIDNSPIFSKYITNGIPQEYSNLNCESFVAGIIEGILDSSYFKCEVSAHHAPNDTSSLRTVYLIKLDKNIKRV